MTGKKSAAITGAGSGLGRAVAIYLADKGYMVFGTAFSDEERLEAVGDFGDRDIRLTVANITKPSEVERWRDVVSDQSPGGLDLLISNAGVLTPGPLELLKLDAIRHEFEVNVFGALSVIMALLPLLRMRKGRIGQVSSGSAFFPMPFNGPSSASKAAMEAFGDVFRSELQPFGVSFVLVQPGNMATGGPAKTASALNKFAESMSGEERELYGDQFAKFSDSMNAMQAHGMAASEAAKALVTIVETNPPPARARIGEDAEQLYQAVRISSDEELDALRRKTFGLGD